MKKAKTKPKTKPQPNLFCFDGLNPNDPHEIKLTLSLADRSRYNTLSKERWAEGTEATVVVTDIPTKKRWQVKRSDCGAGCFCACEAVPANANITDIRLTEHELATVLFSLRDLQMNIISDSQFRDTLKDAEQFDGGIVPLTLKEIDVLCQRINQ